MLRVIFLAVLVSNFLATTSLAEAIGGTLEVAKGEQLASAVGHYARARSLILAAIKEFDAGRSLADPKALLDVKEWRNTLIDRTEDLDRVLAPQPRATETGITFSPDSRLLNEKYK